jgi:hypothetical protein
MKAVDEDDDEESADENDEPTEMANDGSSSVPTKHDPNISALTASEMLIKACYRHVTKNYCGIPNCGYSHDPGIIAAARDQQIIDLTNAKRDMQAGHQASFSKSHYYYNHLVQLWTSTLEESMSVFNALFFYPSEFLPTSCDMGVRPRLLCSARQRIWLSKLWSTLVVHKATTCP